MHKYKYPNKEEHISKHQYFIEQIKSFYKLKREKQTIHKVLKFLRKWYLEHILIQDKKFSSFVIELEVAEHERRENPMPVQRNKLKVG